MIFTDASAMIAIIAKEPEARAIAICLSKDNARIISAVAAWETEAGLRRSYGLTAESAHARVALFLNELACRFVGIGEAEYALAMGAYNRFGKGRHSAALNMGDCFAYACAKSHNAKLLFKGDDFHKTDIVAALQPTIP